LSGCKVAGILIESIWSGDELDCVVIGIGVNVLKGAVPSADLLQFPATSLEGELGTAVERETLLHDILAEIVALRPHLGTDSFIAAWEKALAFRGEQVQVEEGSEIPVTGKLLGLGSDGSLQLRNENGKSVTVRFGDVHLRPQA
jgi:BirA family biotin operon repressor/biotin-[acetyl-CoA-carboxylase] ligase